VFHTDENKLISIDELRFLLTMSKNPPSDKELKEFLDFHEDPKNKDYINIEVVLEKMHADLQSGGKKKGGGKKKK